MSQEMCEMSLQQTQELLRLVDSTLQKICCRSFTGDELYLEALQQVLGGYGKRGPAGILISFHDRDLTIRRARLFHLREGLVMERSEEIIIDPFSAYAMSMAPAENGTDLVISNWVDSSESVETYQTFFPPQVGEMVGAPIKNFVVHRIRGERPGVLAGFNYPGRASVYDGAVLKGLSVLIGSVTTLSKEVSETEQAFIYTIEALARACEAAEEYTGRHIMRVNRYAGALAANLGLPADFVTGISYSAQMHDVGKIKIPQSILLKEDLLDEQETSLMKLHPIYGEQILGSSPRLKLAREIAIAHHENWDGTGYPHGLREEQIPLAGRIAKIADVYDALRSRRSYKPPLTHAEAMLVFKGGDERIDPRAHFDPVMLATFFRIEHIFEGIFDSVHVAGNDQW